MSEKKDNPLVELDALEQYNKSALLASKAYPSLELVRIERIFFNWLSSTISKKEILFKDILAP